MGGTRGHMWSPVLGNCNPRKKSSRRTGQGKRRMAGEYGVTVCEEGIMCIVIRRTNKMIHKLDMLDCIVKASHILPTYGGRWVGGKNRGQGRPVPKWPEEVEPFRQESMYWGVLLLSRVILLYCRR